MSRFTISEQQSYAAMQARLIELLLRHDEQRFHQFYSQLSNYEQERESDGLGRYRELGVLFYLRDELFEHILPRIVRRLSFESPRSTIIEEPSARGRVDWDRTLDAVWAERPGEPPLLLHTRQRRRDFATPENLLAVATLLEYSADIEHILWNEQISSGAEALRHPLNEIVERCERELAFPQFAGLRQAAQRIVDGQQGGTETLEAHVYERLLSGGNSGYEELLDWRQRRRSLRLLNREKSSQNDVLGVNPNRDNYLYQMWIFYELADFLQHKGIAITWDDTPAQLTHHSALRFSWGQEPVEYRLTHDLPLPTFWEDTPSLHPGKNSAPGVRPDFYIARTDRKVLVDEKENTIFWQEPGYILDAKYYKPYASVQAPSDPLKRMIADLNLTGEHYGALLFAFLQAEETSTEPADNPEESSVEVRLAVMEEQGVVDQRSPVPQFLPTLLYQVSPLATIQASAPDIQVQLWRMQPQFNVDSMVLYSLFEAVLADIHQHLSKPVAIRCHGIFLDQLSANGHGQLATASGLVQRNGDAIGEPLENLLVCPKPHIGPWRVDLVRLHDCCENGLVCHIKGQVGAQPPRRLVELQDVIDTITFAHGTSDGTDEEILEVATAQVRAVVKRYQQLIQPNLADYLAWIRQRLEIDELFDETPLLNASTRETLALARFLWEQTENLRAANFAGPTLLFTGVLETIARQTIYQVTPRLFTSSGTPLQPTLGTLGNSKGYGGQNYRTLEASIVTAGHWKPNVAAGQQLPFSKWIDMLRQIVEIRNRAAHDAMISKPDFDQLIRSYFGGTSSGYGLLNGFLLAWKT